MLSEKFNCARSVIVRILNENGITPRGRRDAMFLRMSQTSPEERSRLTTSAHNAVRGISQSIDHRCKIAITKEKTLSGVIAPLEIDVCNMLIDRGFNCIPQKAIGPYNIDIAIIEPPIAIEIFGGGWHNSGTHAARYSKRIEYILNSGFTPIIIWTSGFITNGAIDYIVTLSEKLRSCPPIRCEEHVIRGDGYLRSIGNRKFNRFPGKHLTYYRDVTTGRFNGASWE
jgi:very-short-patch-repair endonuclease